MTIRLEVRGSDQATGKVNARLNWNQTQGWRDPGLQDLRRRRRGAWFDPRPGRVSTMRQSTTRWHSMRPPGEPPSNTKRRSVSTRRSPRPALSSTIWRSPRSRCRTRSNDPSTTRPPRSASWPPSRTRRKAYASRRWARPTRNRSSNAADFPRRWQTARPRSSPTPMPTASAKDRRGCPRTTSSTCTSRH